MFESVLPDSILSDYVESGQILEKIDIYSESIVRELNINREEANLKVLMESGTDSDLSYLLEEAESSFLTKAKATLSKIIKTVSDFIKKVIKTAKEKYGESKINALIESIRKKIDKNPSIANEVITTIDVDKIEEASEKLIDACNSAINSIEIDEEDDEKAREVYKKCQEIEEEYNKKMEKSKKGKEISIKASLNELKQILSDLKSGDVNKTDFINIPDKASQIYTSIAIKLNSLIGKVNKEKWAGKLSYISNAIKKIKEKIGSKLRKEKDVSENVDITLALTFGENPELELYRDTIESVFESVYIDSIPDEVVDESFSDETVDNYFSEGANLDARRFYKEFRKEYKITMKKAKKCIKQKNYSEAEKQIAKIEKSVKRATLMVKSCDSTIGSAIIGYFTNFTITFKRDLLLCLIPLVGIGIQGIVNFVEKTIGIVNSIVDSTRNKQKINADNFNLYKNQLLTQLGYCENAIARTKSALKQIKRSEKKIKKESVDFNPYSEVVNDFFESVLIENYDGYDLIDEVSNIFGYKGLF